MSKWWRSLYSLKRIKTLECLLCVKIFLSALGDTSFIKWDLFATWSTIGCSYESFPLEFEENKWCFNLGSVANLQLTKVLIICWWRIGVSKMKLKLIKVKVQVHQYKSRCTIWCYKWCAPFWFMTGDENAKCHIFLP